VTAYDAGRARYWLMGALALAGATPEQADAVVSLWEANALRGAATEDEAGTRPASSSGGLAAQSVGVGESGRQAYELGRPGGKPAERPVHSQ